MREDQHVANAPGNDVRILAFDEEPSEPFRRDVKCDVGGVETPACNLDGVIIDVGAEDLKPLVEVLRLGVLEERDRDGVCLLTRRAARHPHANGPAGFLVLEQGGKHLGLERLEGIRVAEEASDRDEYVLVQRAQLIAILLNEPDVVLQAVELVQNHAALDPPVDRRLLVLREIVAELGPDQHEQLRKLILNERPLGG